MAEFTLDTSGVVENVRTPDGQFFPHGLGWGGLDAFTQGYITALFAENCDPVALLAPEDDFSRRWDEALDRPLPHDVGFRHLAGETLAAILKDCEEFEPKRAMLPIVREAAGGQFWRVRRAGHWPKFPPLTATLGDDGKVWLR